MIFPTKVPTSNELFRERSSSLTSKRLSYFWLYVWYPNCKKYGRSWYTLFMLDKTISFHTISPAVTATPRTNRTSRWMIDIIVVLTQVSCLLLLLFRVIRHMLCSVSFVYVATTVLRFMLILVKEKFDWSGLF